MKKLLLSFGTIFSATQLASVANDAGNIVNIQGITMGNGEGAFVDLSVVEGKVLDIMSSDTLGLHASA